MYPDQSYMIAVLDERLAAASLTGVIVREGRAIEGLDFRLSAGTSIHGVVTKGAGGPPLKGETVTLVEHGQKLPPELVASPHDRGEEDLPQWATTDAGGRYQFRVGPGRYSILCGGDEPPEDLTVHDQTEIVRDFHLEESSEWKSISGVAIEKRPAGERVIAGALIEAAPIGRHGVPATTVADLAGRFELSVAPGSAMTIFTRDPKATIAGFTAIAADANDVRVYAAPASRITGRVVDSDGRPATWSARPVRDGHWPGLSEGQPLPSADHDGRKRTV